MKKAPQFSWSNLCENHVRNEKTSNPDNKKVSSLNFCPPSYLIPEIYIHSHFAILHATWCGKSLPIIKSQREARSPGGTITPWWCTSIKCLLWKWMTKIHFSAYRNCKNSSNNYDKESSSCNYSIIQLLAALTISFSFFNCTENQCHTSSIRYKHDYK